MGSIIPDDPLDAVLGSTGIVGTPDAKAVLTRARTEATSCLFITGRDVQERKIALDFSYNKWTLTDESFLSGTEERKKIIILLDKTPKLFRPKEISTATGSPDGATRLLLRKMLNDAQLVSPKYGYYGSLKHFSNSSNSCHESLTGSGTNCYYPPVTLVGTSNTSHDGQDIPTNGLLPLDELLLSPSNTLSRSNPGLAGKSYQSYRFDSDNATIDTYQREIPLPKKPDAPPKPPDVDLPLTDAAKQSRIKPHVPPSVSSMVCLRCRQLFEPDVAGASQLLCSQCSAKASA